jgi:hypothetical protein
MERYGTIEAVQEHVHCISYGLIEFSADNTLASSSDEYTFFCTTHNIVIETSFDHFIQQEGAICNLCSFERSATK